MFNMQGHVTPGFEPVSEVRVENSSRGWKLAALPQTVQSEGGAESERTVRRTGKASEI